MAVLAVALVGGLTSPTTTNAGVIAYEYSGAWDGAIGPSAPFGATYVATVLFDNGGMTVENQNFVQADFVSARLQSGAYDFTMMPGDIDSWSTDFTSDALGQLGSGWFDASNGAHDWHFDNDFQDENFTDGQGSAGFFATHTSAPGRLVDAAVPEPGSLAIFAVGALSVIGVRRRRSA
tara:strand:- start:243038 stop:243571 length:534 start_codon:yes stop_codon:yes gene_type:complete